MLQTSNVTGPIRKGLKRFISDAQLHRMTVSELTMKTDLVTLAGVYKEGGMNLTGGQGQREK